MEYYKNEEWNLDIWKDVNGATVYYAKQNKLVRERQISYDFTPGM